MRTRVHPTGPGGCRQGDQAARATSSARRMVRAAWRDARPNRQSARRSSPLPHRLSITPRQRRSPDGVVHPARNSGNGSSTPSTTALMASQGMPSVRAAWATPAASMSTATAPVRRWAARFKDGVRSGTSTVSTAPGSADIPAAASAARTGTRAGAAPKERPRRPSSCRAIPGHTRSPGRRVSARPPANPRDQAARRGERSDAARRADRARSRPIPACTTTTACPASSPTSARNSPPRQFRTEARQRCTARRSCARATTNAMGG